MDIALIAAVSDNGVMGRDNDLPWHVPADLRYFKERTLDKPVIMGRRTWDSIDRRPLPRRPNIVISRQPDLPHEGALLAADLEQALDLAREHAVAGCPEIMVVGGADIYRTTLAGADRLYITEIHMQVTGDVLFPDWDRSLWREVSRELHPAGPNDSCDYSFVVYERP